MNYLAHLYLSGDDDEIMIGNFIGDHVKGRDFSSYSKGVANGIILHRFIDSYTDVHHKVTNSKKKLRPVFKKYSPVIVDMYYDHFLAAKWSEYSTIDLMTYSQYCYAVIERNVSLIPESSELLFRYMSTNNWLHNYRTLEGLDKALTGMSARTPFDSGMENATEFLQINYSEFEEDFENFFDDLTTVVKRRIADFNPRQA